MYSSSSSEKIATGAGSVGIVALIGYALMVGLTVPMRFLAEQSMPVLNLPIPPPPEKVRRPEPQKKAKPMKHEASAQSRKAKASPIVAPLMPPLFRPPVPPVIAALKPNIGAAVKNGASNSPGPGEGAGGLGDGLGGGGDGDGGDTPPRQIKGELGFADMPSVLRAEGVERTVSVRYGVDVDGRASNCSVTGSSGSAELDAITCQLIEQRFRFKPSRDGNGRPVHSTIVEQHSWGLDRRGSGAGS